ncbi:MAG: Omp28-related outer membrane protein [Bacteroidetes bacterium]|nr:Omp28-related outer membrane protein [Bacteroidota bacterium]
MKKMKKAIYILAVIGLILGACDKIEEPYLKQISGGGDNIVHLQIEFLENLEGKYNLNVFIIESGIISPQKNDEANIGPTPDWMDYEHNHLLRSSLTGTWGIELIENPSTDSILSIALPFAIEEGWETDNISIVVFLSNDDTREIIQVSEQDIFNSIANENIRKVLLEEFTGHICVNCPEATLQAHFLQHSFEGKLILVSIHAGDLATPGAAPYDANFTTGPGNEIFNYYEPVGVPTGMVNRADYQGSTVLFKDSWEPAIQELLNLPQQASIEIEIEVNE